ncbi:MAG: outer membrane protein TolC [Bacteriovoracaceae bacterium]|jgi:outer membrane protein TolC
MKYIYPLIFVISLSATAGDFVVTESALTKMAAKSNPSLSEIEATFLNSKVQAEELKDKFGYELYAGVNHINTKEKASNSFQPVFTSVNQYKVGVTKYTKYGVVLDVSRSVDLRSTDSTYTDLTTTSDEIGVQVDLWRDFMGRISKAQFDNAQDLKDKDELQSELSRNALKVNVRKLYWTIVANEEKIRITKNLFIASKKQAADARKRRANSISDKAEVARFESLVHQRKGSILLLEYEREMLHKNLRDLFPELSKGEIKLGDYNLNNTVFEVLACTAKIDQQKDVPYEHTKYDEISSLLRSIQKRQNGVDNTYDDIDLKLDLKLRRVGVSSETTDGTNYFGDYSGSIDDMSDNDREGLTAGVILTIPFGEDKKGTAAVKEALTEKQFDAQILKMNTNVQSTHLQVQRSVKILSQVIQEQKANSQQLTIRVKEMKKKYNQARIPEYALIQDQDSLLQSDLAVVDTQLRVVNTILDYLTVFNTFPCSFNRI